MTHFLVPWLPVWKISNSSFTRCATRCQLIGRRNREINTREIYYPYRKFKSQEKKLVTFNNYNIHCTDYMCPQISTKSVIISWFYWCVPSRDCVSCYEITLIMRFACFILCRYFKSSVDWKIKSSWKSLNREIQCPFSYLLIEIAKIKPCEILTCQNREIKYLRS